MRDQEEEKRLNAILFAGGIRRNTLEEVKNLRQKFAEIKGDEIIHLTGRQCYYLSQLVFAEQLARFPLLFKTETVELITALICAQRAEEIDQAIIDSAGGEK